ncbi:MAG: sialate O-acetylesterase [Planctomycetes bacterium]|nr:sialate O-acetylesterase [Planctomycetota bacterium]
MPRPIRPRLLAALLLAPLSTASAQLTLGAPFQDHMVLQRDRALNVFGHAPAGADVTVSVAGRRAIATADADGRFLAVLPPLAAGGPYRLAAKAGDAEVALDDVLVGEVWIASGQSNMEWQLQRFPDCADDIAASSDPQLRLLLVAKRTATEPLDTLDGQWRAAAPDSVPGFSAVAYFFARELRHHLGVPVGIVASSWGGTRCEAWTRRDAMAGVPSLQPILDAWDALDASYPERRARFDEALAAWEAAKAAAAARGEQAPRRPGEPVSPLDPQHPSALYNGMIAPLVPMTVRGFVWYQGESNAGRGWQYRHLFPAMIEDWRAAFGQGDLAFLPVQLANFHWNGGDGTFWADLREGQLRAMQTLPCVGLATAVDIGNPKDIHPDRKDEVGRRLALWARALCYGHAVVPSGPVYSHCAIEGDHVRLSFDHVGGGLRADGDALQGFTIAGPDGNFVPADARIQGDDVVVSAAGIARPCAVRYGWADDPVLSLRNAEGLPALPFRTDALPLPTRGTLRP